MKKNSLSQIVLGLTVVLALTQTRSALACSAFSFSENGHTYVGKNFDWIPLHDHGALFVNKRGVSKKAQTLRTKNAVEWTSKFGSVTFSQIGIEFPVSGMNEAGLSADILQMPETVYVPETDSRPALNESQWLQYQLDNYQSLSEVIENLEKIRVEQAFIGVHYFICDKTNACGVFEFMNGKYVMHTGSTFEPRVLTNNFYEESISTLKGGPLSKTVIEGSKTAKAQMSPVVAFFANTARSIARFEIAAKELGKWKSGGEKPEAFAFDILGKVEVARLLRTQWSMFYDLNAREVTFRTKTNSSFKKLSFEGIDFSCATPAMMMPVQQAEGGDIKARLKPFSVEENKKLVEENWMIVSSDLRKAAVEYPEKYTRCVRP
ncbi:MAG TPA: linear amide C-N hydrolase [Bdellovibrionales bacterium]|nr:linear amide C-N hydrolase [Bdellovibrionales bacterium]